MQITMKQTALFLLVALSASFYCYATSDIDITLDELVYSETEEDVMWDPTATTCKFQSLVQLHSGILNAQLQHFR